MASTQNQHNVIRRWPACAATAAMLCMASGQALAEFDAGITLGVSKTDNVFLSPPGEKVDDTFYQLAPFIKWTKESKSLDGFLDYRYNYYDYQDTGLDQSFDYLNASLIGKAMEESFQVEVGTSRRQVLKNPDEDIQPGQSPISGNLEDLDQWTVAPGFEKTFGGRINLGLNYRYTDSQYATGEQRNDQTQDAHFRLTNYAAGQGMTWGLKYDYIQTEYEIAPAFEYQMAGAELGYWTSAKMRLFVGGGRESQWDDRDDRSPKDPFWEAGFAYQAGEKLQAEFAAGERSFGSSLRGSLNYQFRRGSMSLGYSEQPTTEGYNRRRGEEFINPENPDDFLTNPGQAERYISERLDWSVILSGRRTDLTFIVFSENRTGRTNADGVPLEDQDQRGINTQFSWQLGTRTDIIFDATLVKRELGDQTEDEFSSAALAVNYGLGARTVVSLSHAYADQEPGATGTTRAYTGNITTLSVTLALL